MASFQFNLNGKTFKVSGPEGFTFDQAQQAFNTQASTGALVNLKPGDILNAAKQAVAGVENALAQVGQIASGVTGALGGGIANSVGSLGSVTGIGGAISSITDSAAATLSKITSSTSIVNGINSADFAKTISAVAPIAGLNPAQVTGTLSAVTGLVNQASNIMSNASGVGSFGLDARQLEQAGILKPGTSNLISSGVGTLTSVLNSPSVFTGANGVTSIDGLLNNASLQSVTQQALMASGVAGLEAKGLEVAKLATDLQGGVAALASKSLDAATSLASGAIDAATNAVANLTASIPDPSAIMKECAFATNFATDILSDAFKEEEVPAPAIDTADRATVDAATSRIIGNPKIPVPIMQPGVYDASGRKLTADEIKALMSA